MPPTMDQQEAAAKPQAQDASGQARQAPVRIGAVLSLRRILATVGAALIAAGPLRGQAPPPPQPQPGPVIERQEPSIPTSTWPGAGPDYVVCPDDDLELDVMDHPELSHDYRVSPTGFISISVLKDPIQAAGLTPRRLTQVITRELQRAGMVDNPHITLGLKPSRLHSVAILGAVKKPQIYPIFGTTTLMDALSQAEGLALDAGSTAIVTRGAVAMLAERTRSGQDGQGASVGSALATVKVDLHQLLEQGAADANLTLYSGDRVTVQRAGVVYVTGAVNRSGGFVLTDEHRSITVLKAVALAESLKNTAQPKRAVIIRKDSRRPEGTEQIPIDLQKILSGHAPDRPLLADDILFVPESRAKKAGVQATQALTEGAALLFYRIP